MANVINSSFSGQVNLKRAKVLYTADDDDDLIVGVWSDFGNSAFSYSSGMGDVGPGSVGYTEINVINNLTNDAGTFGQAASANQYIGLDFDDYRFRPTDVVMYATSTSGGGPYDAIIRVYNDTSGTNEIIYSETVVGGLPGFGSNAYIRITDLQEKVLKDCNGIQIAGSTTGIRVFRLYVYGEVWHEDNIDLPPVAAATTIESFTDSMVGEDDDTEGILYKRNFLTVRPYGPLTGGILTATLSGNAPFTDNHPYPVTQYNPNGANRQVYLPVAPPKNFQSRLINLDGAFTISIYEGDQTTLIQNLSNADGTNILDVAWDGSQWIVTAL